MISQLDSAHGNPHCRGGTSKLSLVRAPVRQMPGNHFGQPDQFDIHFARFDPGLHTADLADTDIFPVALADLAPESGAGIDDGHAIGRCRLLRERLLALAICASSAQIRSSINLTG